MDARNFAPDLPNVIPSHEAASLPARPSAPSAPRPKKPRRAAPALRRADPVPRREGASLYLLGAGARPLLTREGEHELARRIQSGEEAMLRALAVSPGALRELGGIGREIEEGRTRPRDLLRATDEQDHAEDEAARRVLEPLLRAGALAPAVAAALAGGEPADEAEREAAVEELVGLRLHRRVLERVARAALAAPADEPRAWLAGMEAGRRAADRAKSELVERNLRLVLSLAERHRGRGMSHHDLVQEGNIGLMRAADKFDHRRGFRFSTYAAWWVNEQMSRAITEQSPTIRVPVHLVESRAKVARARRAFESQHGRAPTEAEIAERTHLPCEKVRAVEAIVAQPISLDAPVGGDGDARVGDFAVDRTTPAADEEIAHADMREQAKELLEMLTPREQDVLRRRFGLDDTPTSTLAEIGVSLSLSRERVRQIEAEALRKLLAPSERRQLQSYLGD